MKKRILQSAFLLFQVKKFEEITIMDIAEKSKIAKGTVFLYFKTKEEIFLTLTTQHFNNLYKDFEKALLEISKMEEPEKLSLFLKLMENIVDNNRFFFRLLAILHITIEHNIDFETIYGFKKKFHELFTSLAGHLEKAFPFMKNNGQKFLQRVYVLLIGFEQASNPSKIALEVMKSDERFKIYLIDFKSNLIDTVKALIIGMKNDNDVC
jgi:TetR/AcrR family transcriptional regulator